jgi:hypothetical protein
MPGEAKVEVGDEIGARGEVVSSRVCSVLFTKEGASTKTGQACFTTSLPLSLIL